MKTSIQIYEAHYPEVLSDENFRQCDGCPLALAVKEHFNTSNVSIGSFMATIDGVKWMIEGGFNCEEYHAVGESLKNGSLGSYMIHLHN